MAHARNTATVIAWTYGGEGATVKLYVHDEVGRFITVTSLSLMTKELDDVLAAVRRTRELLDQPVLFSPETDDGSDNVRWLPPNP